jgi:predicted PurR-regulated permease PerM
VPAAITLVAQGQTGWAVFLVLWSIILVAGSDNVIRPLIISGNSNASTLLVFVGLLGGISVFGFAGIFMGPLVLTLVATLLQYADSELPRASALGHPATAGAASDPATPMAQTKDAVTEPPSLPAKAEPKTETKLDQ